jgi:uncharacterized membrane protein YkoI
MRFIKGCVAAVLCTAACSNERVTTATGGESHTNPGAGGAATAAVPLEQDRPGLQQEATISDAQARAIALQRVPGGQIVEGELEEEGGRLVYEYEVRAADGRRVIEVQVDARTGAVLGADSEGDDADDGEDADGPEDDEPRR